MRAEEVVEAENRLSAAILEAQEETRHLHEAVKDARQLIKKYEDEIKDTIQAAVVAGYNSINENAKEYLHQRIDEVVDDIAQRLRTKLKL